MDIQDGPDGLPRTDWFVPELNPTIPGVYECTTGSGHIFKRLWDGASWISSVTKAPTTLRMKWRGVTPYSIATSLYPIAVRILLHPTKD